MKLCEQVTSAPSHSDGELSGFKGVSWANGVWCARIKINGKTTILGYSYDREECGRMYDVAAKELFGESARLNFEEEI